jgi:hypothetical protein
MKIGKVDEYNALLARCQPGSGIISYMRCVTKIVMAGCHQLEDFKLPHLSIVSR